MTQTETLKEIRNDAPSRLGPDFLAAAERSVRERRESGIVERFAKIGEIAPAIEALNAKGESIRLTDLIAKGPAVISFYRGGWCHYCCAEQVALQDILPSLRKKGADLVSITPQISSRIESNLKRYNLSFEILNDPGNRIAQSFEDTWALPVPANCIVGTDQAIIYAAGDPDYTTRPDPLEILEFLP